MRWIASGGMPRISEKPEIRRPLSKVTGGPASRPRPLLI